MIFPTMDEHNRVMDMISKREDFSDLKQWQQDVIRGMYYAIERLEHLRYENQPAEDDKQIERIYKESAVEILDEAVDSIELEIADMYVAYSDNNYCENMENE